MRTKRKSKSKNERNKRVKTSGQYCVEAIVDWALDKSGRLMYLLKWESYESSDNSWEFDEQLFDCDDVRREFQLLSVNGRHPPKNSWEEFDKFVDYIKNIIDVNYKDIAVLNKLSTKRLSLTELKFNKTIEEIKSKVRNGFNQLIDVRFEQRNNVQRNDAKDLVQKVAQILTINDNFGTITDFFEFVDKRKTIVNDLNRWQQKQNKVIAKEAEGLPISIVNDVDLEIPSLEKYITKYLFNAKYGSGLKIDDKPVESCQCENCYRDREECCTSVIGFPMAYNSKGLLSHSRFSTIIFECNSNCKCGIDCPNRVIQRGRQTRLEIFRTENRGWGVRTLDAIARGAFITQYTGEVIPLTEAENRSTTYLFDLNTNLDSYDTEYTYVVDAQHYGNVARFVNHSCQPNCRVLFAWINNYDKLLPLIALFAIKPIRANDELTYDYGMELMDLYNQTITNTANDDGLSTDSGTASSIVNKPIISGHKESDDSSDEENDSFSQSFTHKRKVNFEKIDCKCGANNCRKFLYS